MGGSIAPFTAGLLVSAGISIAVVIFIQRSRSISGVRAFSYQMVFQAVWALGFAFETIVPDLTTKILFRKIAWIGILLVPACWALFVLQYTRNDDWLDRRIYFAMAVPIGLLLLSAFTNEAHYLFWSSVELAPGIGTGAAYVRGPLFWVAVGLSYAVIITALVEIARAAMHLPRFFTSQIALLVSAAVLPVVTSILFVIKIVQPLDWTPLGFSLNGLIVTWAILRYRLFNLVPVARGKLFEILPDGILVLDAQKRVVDANPAMLAAAKFENRVPVGESIEALFAAAPELRNALQQGADGESEIVKAGDGGKIYRVQNSTLPVSPDFPDGQLVLFRDQTAMHEAEERLRFSEESLRRLFESNPFPLVILGLADGTIHAFNQAFLDFSQVSAETLLHRRALDFIVSADKIDQLVDELKRNGHLHGHTIELKRSENDIRSVLLTADTVEYQGEKRLLVSFVDLSERLRLEQAEHEQRIFAEVLRDTSAVINSTLELDEVLERILQNMTRVVRHDVATILLINGQGIASIARTRGFNERGVENPFGKIWLHVDSTPNLRWMVENKRPEIKLDVFCDPEWIKFSGFEWIRGHLAAPMLSPQGVVGFINLDSTEPGYFSETDAERLMIFANQAGVAIENARLYARIRNAAQEADILQQITLAVGSSLDFDQVIQRIFELIDTLVPSDSAGVQLIEGDEVVLKAIRGFKNNDAILGTHWALAGTANERVLHARESMVFSDVQAEFSGYLVPPHNQIRSVLMIPLIAGGEVIGFLSLDSWVLAHFGTDDLRLANLFSGNIAAALENALLYEESRRRTAELEILNRAGMAVTSGLDLNKVLMVLYEQCRQAMASDSFYVALYQEESGEIEFPIFQDQGVFRKVPPLNIAVRKGMAGCVIEEQRTIYLPDTLGSSTPEKYSLIRYGGIPTRAYLGVPMFSRDKVIGVISIQSTQPNAYSKNQVRLLETISAQAAVAIENARLYQQSQTAATTDELTQLLNRRELFRRAELEFERAVRYRHPLSAMMIDIDHFKLVNDTYGHLSGDQVLRSLSRVCQENMRLVDVVGRFGGEEILILMPETTADPAMAAGERLRRQIAEMVVTVGGDNIQVTISAGVAGGYPDAEQNLKMMIDLADKALFTAKSAGRNRVCLAEA